VNAESAANPAGVAVAALPSPRFVRDVDALVTSDRLLDFCSDVAVADVNADVAAVSADVAVFRAVTSDATGSTVVAGTPVTGIRRASGQK
jgi:hypothetical protein